MSDRIKIRHAAANTLLAVGRAAVEVDGKAKENRAIIARLGEKAAFSRKDIVLDDEEERTTRPAEHRRGGTHISGFLRFFLPPPLRFRFLIALIPMIDDPPCRERCGGRGRRRRREIAIRALIRRAIPNERAAPVSN